MLPESIQRALQRYRVLTDGVTVELLIASKIVKCRLELTKPESQLWLLNNDSQPPNISVRITQELERLAAHNVAALDKLKQDNAQLIKEGLDLNAILSDKGLDLDLMEQKELEHY